MVQVYGSGVAVTWGAVPSSWARFDVVVGFGGSGLLEVRLITVDLVAVFLCSSRSLWPWWPAASIVSRVVREEWNAWVMLVTVSLVMHMVSM